MDKGKKQKNQAQAQWKKSRGEYRRFNGIIQNHQSYEQNRRQTTIVIKNNTGVINFQVGHCNNLSADTIHNHFNYIRNVIDSRKEINDKEKGFLKNAVNNIKKLTFRGCLDKVFASMDSISKYEWLVQEILKLILYWLGNS